MQQKYHFTARKFFNIWFSKNPDEGLDVFSQLQVIKNRALNPEVEITVVFCSSILSSTGIKHLNDFCAHNKLSTLDITSHSFRSLLTDDYDSQLHAFAVQELDKWVKDKGGNPAAASDLTRWISPIIDKCGNYLDFDVIHNFNAAPAIVTGNAPLMLPIKFHSQLIPNSTIEVKTLNSINNDILLFARDPESGTLSHHAITRIKLVQEELIKKKISLHRALFHYPLNHVVKFPDAVLIHKHILYDDIIAKNPKATIHDMRLALKDLDQQKFLMMMQKQGFDQLKALIGDSDINKYTLDECKILFTKMIGFPETREMSDNQISIIKHILEMSFTLYPTGSVAIIRAFDVKSEIENKPIPISLEQYLPFASECINCDLAINQLSQFILYSNNSYRKKSDRLKEQIGLRPANEIMQGTTSVTWLQEGQERMRKFSIDAVKQITTIQSFVRSYNARQQLHEKS